MARENKSLYAILGCLSKHQWMSGYDIKRIMEKMSASYWAESNAQIYPLLKKLHNDHMVDMAEDSQGPRKRYLYKIKPKGRDELIKWLSTPPADLPLQRNEWLLKLSLGQHLNHDELTYHIQSYLDKLSERKIKLDNILEHINDSHKGKADQPYLQATYRYGQLALEAQIQWCKEMLAQFKHS
ncbi:PadR family transcriptional regulator [Thiotrichales bacterium 19S3-7]|nr:PadR family transcriptional regulator [Thiotrichales bacterium 19S3-7]MCF6801466.1 PadR family transcriptional regulator [Thiotrichales bacterium 19S3-11]